MQRGRVGRQGLERPVRELLDDAFLGQALERVVNVEVHIDPKRGLEISLDRCIGLAQVADVDPLLGEHAVEQHLLLDVLLRRAIGQQRHHAPVVGHGVEIEVLRQHHHVARALIDEG